jgi:hypothetical protein
MPLPQFQATDALAIEAIITLLFSFRSVQAREMTKSALHNLRFVPLSRSTLTIGEMFHKAFILLCLSNASHKASRRQALLYPE